MPFVSSEEEKRKQQLKHFFYFALRSGANTDRAT